MKRIVFTAILFLLLVSGGAIVNVAVAWGIVLVTKGRSPTAADASAHGITRRGTTQSGAIYSLWSVDCRSGGASESVVSFWFAGPNFQGALIIPAPTEEAEEALPSWAAAARPSGNYPTNTLSERRLQARGWPRLALWSGIDRITRPGSSTPAAREFAVLNGWLLRDESQRAPSPVGTDALILPLARIWPGFVINTLFYAIVLWLFFSGPFVLRRLIRIKRGRCVKCGYDLRGQPPEGAGAGCPECGWGRDATAARVNAQV